MHVEGESVGPLIEPPSVSAVDLESLHGSACEEIETEKSIMIQITQTLSPYDDLCYTKMLLGGRVEVRAMLDNRLMACIVSSRVLPELLHAGVLKSPSLTPTEVVLVGCGGSKTRPRSM